MHTDEIRAKWQVRRQAQADFEEMSLDRISPERVVMLYSDCGGEMPCKVVVRAAGAFDTVQDMMGALRHQELPRALDWDSNEQREIIGEAEDYLGRYADAHQVAIRQAIDMMDSVLVSESPQADQVAAAVASFNQVAEFTNPQLEVVAWGSVVEVLRTPEVLAELETIAEDDEDEELLELIETLRAGTDAAAGEGQFTRLLDALAALEIV